MFFLTATSASAQLLEGKVDISLEKLPQINQNKLQGVDRIVQNYINERDWGPNDYEYTFPLDIKIFFNEAVAVSFEDRYKAQITVSNRDNMVYSDRRWEFSLEPGVKLMYDEQFDPFRSLIDYYVFMALGFEHDKVRKFGGTPYFDEAARVCQQARFSSRYFLGWDKREEWIEQILDKNNETLRYLNYLYYTGEWLYYTERDRKEAKQYLLYATRLFDRLDNDKLERFFNLNYHNYANALADYGEFSALSKLAGADPNPDHATLYERLLQRR